MGDEQELSERVKEEALRARARYRDRGAFAGSTGTAQVACWSEAVRPLVERIVELEQAPAKVDAAHGVTLIKRIGREVGPALDRWQACNDGNHKSMAAAIGPLVAANMGLESDLKTARDSGQAYADKLTAAQAAGRDQASEIERLRGEIADATETIKGADENRRRFIADIIAITKRADDAEAEAERLTTTIDVLAGRLAARGQS